jgi:hypothetical protein
MMAQSLCGTIRRIRRSPFILLIGLILTLSVVYTSTAEAQVSHSVTFWERGVGSDYTGVVAIIGGGDRTVNDLGTCFTISTYNDVTFSYQSPLVVDSSKQYVWIWTTSETNPPSTFTQSGTVPAGMDGSIFGYYETQYKVSFSSNPTGSGTTTPSGSNIWISEGTTQISAVPTSGYSFSSWSSTGSITINNPNSAATSATISGPGTITANFVEQKSIPTYSLSPYVNGHGSINPSVPVTVRQGADKTFTFTPDDGYRVSAISVDGNPVPVANSYTFSNVKADHSIRVTFEANAPTEVSVTIDSNPSGQNYITVDGSPIATPHTFSWSIGSVHTLVASSLVAGEVGVRYAFSSWSDGGAQTHDYTVSDSPTLVTADYDTQYQLTVKTNFGKATPSDGSWFDTGSKVTVKAEAPSAVDGESYVFGGWKGSFGGYTGGNNPSGEFTMNGPVSEETTWQHIYQLKINSAYGVTGGSGWYEVGQTVHASVDRSAISPDSDTQIVLRGWGGDASGTGLTSNPLVMDGPKTATAEWKTQYRLIFTQSGLDGMMLGVVNDVVLTVDGTKLGVDALPYVTKWMDAGTIVNYAYTGVVTKSMGGVYKLDKLNGPTSPIILENTLTISGSYNFQTLVLQWNNFPYVIFLPLVMSIILIIYYQRRKKQTVKTSS